MALVIKKSDLFGSLRVVVAEFTFDASYATGGEACDSGLGTVLGAFYDSAKGYVFEYDYANKKLKAFYADYSTSTDGVLIQVASAVDLSAVVVRMMFVGM